jgi:5'-nucleotidase
MIKILKGFLVLFLTFFIANSSIAGQCDIQILHTNDVHGRLLPFELGISDYNKDVGGIARRVTLIKTLQKQNNNSCFLILDAGDFAQGTIFFNLYNGIPDVEFMNKLHYDALTIGNHEFDKGSEVLAAMIDEAKFPFLAANLSFNEKSPLYKKTLPYTIIDCKGCTVGIIGLVTDEVRIISNIGEHTKVLDPARSAQKYINEIKNKTDLIIILSHLGYEEDKKLSGKISGANIIIGGHSHTTTYKPTIVKDLNNNDVIIVQAGEFGKNLGSLKVSVDNDRVSLIDFNLIPVDSTIKPDTEVNKTLDRLKLEYEKIATKIVGETKTFINLIRDEVRTKETSGGNFFVDAIKYKFPEVDVVLQNGGAIRSDRILPPGKISLAEIIEIHPFENEVILFDLKGKDLKACLERSVSALPYSQGGFLQVSGLVFTADVSNPPQVLSENYLQIKKNGNRVVNVFVNGSPLDPEKTYRIASNSYLLNGGDGFWPMKKGATNIYNTGMSITQVVVDYLEKNSPVNPEVEDRIKVINIPGYVKKKLQRQ